MKWLMAPPSNLVCNSLHSLGTQPRRHQCSKQKWRAQFSQTTMILKTAAQCIIWSHGLLIYTCLAPRIMNLWVKVLSGQAQLSLILHNSQQHNFQMITFTWWEEFRQRMTHETSFCYPTVGRSMQTWKWLIKPPWNNQGAVFRSQWLETGGFWRLEDS